MAPQQVLAWLPVVRIKPEVWILVFLGTIFIFSVFRYDGETTYFYFIEGKSYCAVLVLSGEDCFFTP